MNQDQRKFLVKTIEDRYRDELQKIHDAMPNKPSLNNYLVAAALDGSLKLKSLESIQESIRLKVLSFGPHDTLINENDDFFNSRRRRDKEDYVELGANILFEYPQAYFVAMAKYKEEKVKMQEKAVKLERTKDSLILKVQIGSNESLDKLVADVDNMIDIGLLNDQLMLDKE